MLGINQIQIAAPMSYGHEANYMRYLNKSINLHDKHPESRPSKNNSFVYVPPHQRQQNYQSLKISQVDTSSQAHWHNRSKSFDADLSKKQNTFGLQKTQDSNTHLGRKEGGFVSPKFKLGSEERKQNYILMKDHSESQEHDSMNMHSCSMESEDQRVSQLEMRLQQKQDQLDECQRQIRVMIQSHEQQIAAIKVEGNAQLEKQIESYCKELKEVRKELHQSRALVDKYKRRQQSLSPQSRKKDQKIQELKDHIQYLQTQLKQHETNWTSPLNDSTNMVNGLSVIERQTDTSVLEKTFKCIADELNVDKFRTQSFSFLNNEVLEGVKTLKNLNREQQKFIKCLKDLVQSCAPKSYFAENEPTLKDMWKFVKQMLNGYLDSKKTLKNNQDTVDVLCKYLDCVPAEVCAKAASLMVENEVLRRIKENVRVMLGLTHISNIREIERQFDHYLAKLIN